MADQPMSRREKLLQQQEPSFVGRSGELAVFEANLRRNENAREFRFLFHVRGQSGVGKSTLLERWKGYARGSGATVYLDDAVHGPQEAMKAIADQLALQGLPMKAFAKRFADLRRRQKAAEHGLPAGEGSPGAEGVAQAVLSAGGSAFGVPLGGDQLARSVGQLWGRRREQRDGELVDDPVSALTKVFVNDLAEAARDLYRVVLFFDVYERTGPGLDRWLRDLVKGERYGELPLKVVVVIAGQGKLAPAVWGEMSPHVEEVVLDSFTEEEARDLMARRGIADEDTVTAILDVSDRLPVLVDMLASHRPTGPGEVLDPADTAVERFLKWETDPTRRQAILDCALPQEVDADIYRALVGSEAVTGGESWLAALPFVTSHGGRYRYHDVVRTQILRLQRTRSATDWARRHTTLADHHAHQRTTLEPALPDVYDRWANEQWRDHRAAEMYHRLCANPHDTRLAILDDCVHAAGTSTETLTRWVRLIHHAGHDSGNTTLTERATALGNNTTEADPQTALRHILAEPGLPTTTRALAHHTRGQYHQATGDHPQAIADFTHAIRINPGNALALRFRAYSHLYVRAYDQVVADIDRARALTPDNAADHLLLSAAQHMTGNLDQAQVDLDRAAELDPDSGLPHLARCFAHFVAGDPHQALAELAHATSPGPEQELMHILRGWAHIGAGDPNQALAELAHATSPGPAQELAHIFRGFAHIGVGDPNQALAELAHATSPGPAQELAHLARGLAHIGVGDPNQALAELAHATSPGPEQELIHAARGFTHLTVGNYELAVADLSRAIDLNPSNEMNLASRGGAHYQLGHYYEAIADFSRAIELNPDNAWNHHARGSVHHAAGLLSAAAGDFDRAGELAPDEVQHGRWRNVVRYEVEGRGDEA
ncbi:tetratricopeptide repeat protein [Streptomyces bohaiensis]|uniref:Tetratricopeptide repeat protein n=1 Tax=Streptomyces bohaiensis TaxID=1431344 RepID=A0ABX1CHC7_9ACTN|nr:tetratricopeptide repeat protein [Streptomyces bohaiensis]NJQ16567.1 tetratricopeptide repeat protein [Streptomyces bohaiensis]